MDDQLEFVSGVRVLFVGYHGNGNEENVMSLRFSERLSKAQIHST